MSVGATAFMSAILWYSPRNARTALTPGPLEPMSQMTCLMLAPFDCGNWFTSPWTGARAQRPYDVLLRALISSFDSNTRAMTTQALYKSPCKNLQKPHRANTLSSETKEPGTASCGELRFSVTRDCGPVVAYNCLVPPLRRGTAHGKPRSGPGVRRDRRPAGVAERQSVPG